MEMEIGKAGTMSLPETEKTTATREQLIRDLGAPDPEIRIEAAVHLINDLKDRNNEETVRTLFDKLCEDLTACKNAEPVRSVTMLRDQKLVLEALIHVLKKCSSKVSRQARKVISEMVNEFKDADREDTLFGLKNIAQHGDKTAALDAVEAVGQLEHRPSRLNALTSITIFSESSKVREAARKRLISEYTIAPLISKISGALNTNDGMSDESPEDDTLI